jgi:aspartyl protease family protein
MFRRSFALPVVCGLVVLLLCAPAVARKWTSAKGRFTIDAEYVDATDDAVRLKKVDGAVITVPLDKLSEDDRKHIAELLKAEKTPVKVDPNLTEEKAEAILKAKGLIYRSGEVRLPEESDLSAGLKEATKLRSEMLKSGRMLTAVEAQADKARQVISNLVALNVQLNAQLINVRQGDVTTNNKIIGAIQANEGQITLYRQGAEKLREQVRLTRGKANEAREAYIEKVLAMRELADSILVKYSKLAADAEVQGAIAKLSEGDDTPIKLAATREYLGAERKLQTMEESVLSESIPLRSGGGGSYYVSVMINGKYTHEMVVDSGSSMLAVPHEMAKQCGIEVTSEDQKIILVLADGSEIEAHEVTLASVRVGKFTIDNVRCAVFGPDATEAEPLLGMTFLNHFKFEINASKNTLTMVRVEEENKRK